MGISNVCQEIPVHYWHFLCMSGDDSTVQAFPIYTERYGMAMSVVYIFNIFLLMIMSVNLYNICNWPTFVDAVAE